MSLVLVTVRLWVRAYTAPLPRPVRDRRRREIDADVWEQVELGAGAGAVLTRLARGVVDDLAWSLSTCATTAHRAHHVGSALGLAAPALVLLWTVALVSHRRGGILEVVGTKAYHLSFAVAAIAVAATLWWLVVQATTGRRGSA